MSHWSQLYSGKKWKRGAEGEDSYDCWGLFRKIQNDIFGIEVPKIDVDRVDLAAASEAFKKTIHYDNWKRISSKEKWCDGDAILMSTHDVPAHIGVIIEEGFCVSVIHCLEGMGVSVTKECDLAYSGWRQFKVYRWIG